MSLTVFPGTEVRPLTTERVRASLHTRLLGREVQQVLWVGSTNDLARDRARSGAPEGLLVLAEEQTAGRGRLGRRWEAPFGSCLLASLLLRPSFLSSRQAFLLTAMAGLAIERSVAQETGLQPELKWPNDLLIGGRKACGILVELEPRQGMLQENADLPAHSGTADALSPRLGWAILGWGLNVNVDFSAAPEMAERATSLAVELGRPLHRLPLLRACLEQMEHLYDLLRAGREEEVWAAWRDRLGTLDRSVEVDMAEGHLSGIAVDVDRSGALLVRRGDGTVVRVLAGDVSLTPSPRADNPKTSRSGSDQPDPGAVPGFRGEGDVAQECR